MVGVVTFYVFMHRSDSGAPIFLIYRAVNAHCGGIIAN